MGKDAVGSTGDVDSRQGLLGAMKSELSRLKAAEDAKSKASQALQSLQEKVGAGDSNGGTSP